MNVCSFALIVQNPAAPCPPEIFDRQVAVPVRFFDFERRKKAGFVIVDRELEDDIRGLFDLILRIRFPIASAIPISSPPFFWDDDRSMALNNTSGFNFRLKYGRPVPAAMSQIDFDDLSLHALGQAIDINPILNPWIKNGVIKPNGASYNPHRRGTLTPDSPVVIYLKARGWIWGGDWENPKDCQHFQKQIIY